MTATSPIKTMLRRKRLGERKDWPAAPAHWERLTLLWEINKHLWGGGRMWKIIKERVKSPEGARESMLRVKAELHGIKFKNLDRKLCRNSCKMMQKKI